MEVPFRTEGHWLRSQHRVPVTVYGSLGQPIEILPGAVANSALVKSMPPRMEAFDPAEVIASSTLKRIVIVRPGELGDLIVTAGAIRVLRKFFKHLSYIVCVNPRYSVMEALFPDIGWRPGTPTFLKNDDTTMSLDMTGFYELDHSSGGVRVNRVERFLSVFGIYWQLAHA